LQSSKDILIIESKIGEIMKKLLLGFILGGLLFGSIVYAASYNANDISYTKEGTEINVNEALNELYDISKKVEVTHLGAISGGTYDATGISGYQNLTADNFILAVKSIPATMAYSTSKYVDSYANGGIPDGFAPTKSYNASTGKLTYTSNIRCYADSSSNNASAYATVTYDLYLIG